VGKDMERQGMEDMEGQVIIVDIPEMDIDQIVIIAEI
jgi:hypothetical protein